MNQCLWVKKNISQKIYVLYKKVLQSCLSLDDWVFVLKIGCFIFGCEQPVLSPDDVVCRLPLWNRNKKMKLITWPSKVQIHFLAKNSFNTNSFFSQKSFFSQNSIYTNSLLNTSQCIFITLSWNIWYLISNPKSFQT